ncbi:murein hydrolase activator EnvC family protein, partial [Alloalcanivorax xenomutans]|uniref:murein hydrolase activator EnvC family protein n=1 Tax=Alloalcanivorax xenomutans TaxID=1094342 RepID=UPI003C349AEA
ASYQAGREERIKLLLNQEEPERVARLLRYQEYFQRARRDRLVNLEGELVDLRQVAREVADARADLLDRRTALARHRQELEAAGREREKALAALGQSLENRGGQLSSLRADQQRLERLLEQMRQAAEQAARESPPSGPSRPAAGGGTPFGKLAGGLPWPVHGPVLTSYNSRREGELRWTGVILGVDEGTPVQAVHPGRVVFADWLRGFGLLIILDHGDGYLTLYGYNQSLLRQVGDRVATGDVLSLAGRSGGNSRSALYFEIRHRGKAVNPARWCDRRVTLPPIARNN